jgi:RNA polymerase sigma-70 factor (ECF subfamily)
MDEDAYRDMPAEPLPTAESIGAGELFRVHARFVASFLSRLGVPASDLDDLVQEVFVVAHRRGGYVSGPAQPRSWLVAIALRVAQAGRRSRISRSLREAPGDTSLEDVPTGASDPAARLEAQRSVERVQRALDTLPLEHRAAFMLYELEGESCESIAAVWNVPVGTIYSRLHKARRRFMQAYDALTEAPAVCPQRAVGD